MARRKEFELPDFLNPGWKKVEEKKVLKKCCCGGNVILQTQRTRTHREGSQPGWRIDRNAFCEDCGILYLYPLPKPKEKKAPKK